MLAHVVVLGMVVASAANTGREIVDAARADDQAAVAALLRQSADVNARDEDGSTALAWASYRGNGPLVKLLLQHGANPNLATEMGLSPLALAIANGAGAVVPLLLSKGADPNIARENGETPLMTAVRLGQVQTVKLLLERGANVNARENKFHQTALMWAAGNPAVVR